ncbi:unnamed protein product, partial [Brassica oleracea var. botrytis]
IHSLIFFHSHLSIRLKSHQLSHISLFRSGQLRNDGDDNVDDEDTDSLGRSAEAHRKRRRAGVDEAEKMMFGGGA